MSDLRFSPGHLWVRVEGDAVVLGLTDYFQDQMGDIISLDLPDQGDEVSASRRMGEVESESATSPLQAPLTGEVLDVNGEVLASPDLVNQEPYEAGWLLRVHLHDASELNELLSEEEYAEMTTEV
ncbi:MAG: glycine cleavage system protein GcvH [Candidatus Dormibacteraceae bacterium]